MSEYNVSPSYNPKACCGSDCYSMYSATPEEPCWGDVEAIDEQCTEDYEDCWWIHGCQGHKDVYNEPWVKNVKYNPEPKATE
jgi:hypothetical protein